MPTDFSTPDADNAAFVAQQAPPQAFSTPDADNAAYLAQAQTHTQAATPPPVKPQPGYENYRLPFHSVGGGMFAPGAAPAKPFEVSPESAAAADTIKKINESTPEQLATDHTFDAANAVSQFHTALSPAQIVKLAKADALQKQQHITMADVGRGVAKAPGAIKDFIVGLNDLVNSIGPVIGQAGYNLGGGTTQSAAASGDPELQEQAKKSSEALAGLESGVTSFGQILRNIYHYGDDALARHKGEATPIEKAKTELFDRAANITQQNLIAQGRGEAAKAVAIDADVLAKEGVELDPEVIQRLAGVESPVNWVPLLAGARIAAVADGTFNVLNKAGLPILTGATRKAAEKTLNGISNVLNKVRTAKIDLPLIKQAPVAATVAGAIAHATGTGKFGSAVIGAGVQAGLYTAEKAAALAASKPVLDFAGRVASGAAGGAAFGAALNLGAETPQEAADNLATGAAFGAAGGATHTPKLDQAFLNHIQHTIGSHFTTAETAQPVADYKLPNAIPALEAQHDANLQQLKTSSPLAANILNRARAGMQVSEGRPSYLLTEEQAVALNPALAGKDGANTVTLPDGKTGLVWVLGKDGAPALGHEVGHFVNDFILNDKEKAALDKVTEGKWQEGFNEHYLKSEGLTDEQRKAITPDDLKGELRAEIIGAVINGGDLSNVPKGIQKSALGVTARLIERLGMYEPGTAPGVAAPHVTGFGTKLSPVAHQVAQEAVARWMADPAIAEALKSPEKVAAPAPAATPGEAIGNQSLTITPAHEHVLELMKPVVSTKEHEAWTQLLEKVKAGTKLTPQEQHDWTVFDNTTQTMPPEVAQTPEVTPPVTPEVKSAPAPAPAPEIKPAPAEPTSAPAPTAEEIKPVTEPNIRVTREQQNAFQPTPERTDIGIQEADKALANATPEQKAIFKTLREQLRAEQGQVRPVEIVHSGAEETEQPGGVRTKRRAEQAAPAARKDFQKLIIPNGFNVTGEGKVQLRAFSPDKVIANANQLAAAMEAKGVAKLSPYEIKDGKFTPDAQSQLNADLESYLSNQAAGFKGTGEPLVRPAGHGGFIPPENKSATVTPLSKEKVDFLNTVQAIAPPKTARVNKDLAGNPIKPVNVRAYELAKANNKEVTQPGGISNKDIQKQTYGPEYNNQSIAEPNLFRKKLDEAGVATRQLIEATERINLEDIKSAAPRNSSRLRAPVTDVTAAGFLPKRVAALTPEEFSKEMSADKDGIRRGGIQYGLKLAADKAAGTDIATERSEIQALQAAAIDKSKAFMKAKDFTNAMAEGTRATWLREVVEAADNPDRYKKLEASHQFLPQTKTEKIQPNDEVRKVAMDYNREAGITAPPHVGNLPINEALSKRIAAFYDGAKHEPENPEVKKSYDAFKSETVNQYNHLTSEGYVMEPWTEKGQPYKNSAEMAADVRDNKHIYYFPSEGGFGTKETAVHPLLEPSGVKIDGKDVPVNDLFRAVHDIFGHTAGGYEFGPRGELNAFASHAAMYSDEARPAMAAETMGQNSWVNFGKHLEVNGVLPKKGEPGYKPQTERPFAEQKATVLPQGMIEAARKAGPQFLPSHEPRAIKAPAVEDENGKRFEGPMHLFARHAAEEAGSKGPFKDGFVTNNGEFLDRDQAYNRAVEMKQYQSLMGETELESTSFNAQQRRDAAGYDKGTDPLSMQFLPKKKGNVSNEDIQEPIKPKMWMLPNENIEKLNNNVHEDYLAENAKDLNKRFGTKFTSEPDQEARLAALNKGFVRMAYEPNGGRLNIEANVDKFTKGKRDKLFDFIEKHLRSIDNISVSLLNNAGRSVKSDTRQLFNLPKEERMNNIPFISDSGSASNFLPKQSVTPEDFQDEKSIKSALAKPGWTILTATREDVGSHTHEKNKLANRELEDMLKKEGYDYKPVSGSYKGVDQGKNFLVTGISPEKAVELGQEFGQDSVLTSEGLLHSDGAITPADHSQTVIGPEAEKQDFFSRVAVGPAFSLGLNFDKKTAANFLPKQTKFEDNYDRAKLNEMGKATKMKHWPEAIFGEKNKHIPSEIVDSPRYKEAKDSWDAQAHGWDERTAAVNSFGDALVDKYKQFEHIPETQAGREWYSEVAPALQKHFGEDATMFAELLAATSPRNSPKQNWDMALEAYRLYKTGWYDRNVKLLNEGLAKSKDGSLLKDYLADSSVTKRPVKPSASTAMQWWIDKHNIKVKKSPRLEKNKPVEKLYSMHSDAVLQVLARRWLDQNRGPKTENFVKNLAGTGHEATIDLWADRTLREAGYKGYVDRWRIQPENVKGGVNDKDFAFGQEAFRNAAEKLGMKPDELQGALWFAEKVNWAQKGWAPLDLGDFRPLLRDLDLPGKSVKDILAKTPATREEALKRLQPVKKMTQSNLDILPLKK